MFGPFVISRRFFMDASFLFKNKEEAMIVKDIPQES